MHQPRHAVKNRSGQVSAASLSQTWQQGHLYGTRAAVLDHVDYVLEDAIGEFGKLGSGMFDEADPKGERVGFFLNVLWTKTKSLLRQLDWFRARSGEWRDSAQTWKLLFTGIEKFQDDIEQGLRDFTSDEIDAVTAKARLVLGSGSVDGLVGLFQDVRARIGACRSALLDGDSCE